VLLVDAATALAFEIMNELPCFQVDAFTRRAFAGNPAAVVPLEAWLPDALMQQIAGENAVSETAFFVARGEGEYELRWFTPKVEIDLCGHATLATAFVLMTRLAPTLQKVRFHSRSGPLEVIRGEDVFTLDLPARPPAPAAHLAEAVTAALGARPRELLRARDPVALFERAEEVRGLRPDFGRLAAIPDVGAVIVTAPGTGDDTDVDFVSRFFAPAKGVPEDPVTGSAHCTLTPLWAERLGKLRLRARQVSARSGELECELAGERVKMSGHAVLVKSGVMHV
jgi:PhzF family phenazine biosynthesis protein